MKKQNKNSQFPACRQARSILNSQFKWGFTLIEMIIVVSVIAVMLPLIFSIIFSILRSQVKVYRLAQVKREGDSALVAMETTIRNSAIGVYSDQTMTSPQCDDFLLRPSYPASDGSNFYFQDTKGNYFRYSLSSGNIASSSAAGASNLVSDKVLISSFQVSCARSGDFSSPLITISYTVTYNTTEGISASATIPYQLRIKLRNE